MEEKDTMILEYNPKTDCEHIYFIWDRRPISNPNWKNLGKFHGTMSQANKEIEKRIRQYKKDNNLK